MKFLFKAVAQVYGDHLLGETGLPYLSVVLRKGRVHRFRLEVSGPFTGPLYEITWLLYQLCHLGPITSATDEPG